MKKNLILGFAALVLFVGCQKQDNNLAERVAKLEQRVEELEKKLTAPPRPPREQEQTSAYDLPINGSYVLGNPNAPITVTKFTDYQCPFCARTHEGFIEKLFEDDQLKDKVKVVFKHFPLSFHKQARPASKFALAAGEQGSDCFWKMTEKLYAGQKELSEENYIKWAGEVKCKQGAEVKPLDVAKVKNDYKNNDAKYEEMIKKDMDLGMNTANVRGTPSLFVNGWKLDRRDAEGVKDIINKKNLIAGGLK